MAASNSSNPRTTDNDDTRPPLSTITTTISLTQRHIGHGIDSSRSQSPIALAINERLNFAWTAYVTIDVVGFRNRYTRETIGWQDIADEVSEQGWMREPGKWLPGTFEVEIPADILDEP